MAEESFIPKKLPPRVAYPAEGFGLFFRIALILFLVAALFTGGLFVFRNFTLNNLNNQKSVLQKLEIEFEPKTVAELERVSNAIASAEDILRNRARISSVFELIEANTLNSVNFSNFSYSLDKNTAALSGEAASYRDVALQASVFESSPETASATFGNLALKDTGNVSFTLNIILKK